MMNQQAHYGRLLRRRDIEALLGKSRSWIYSVIDPKSRYYDPQFPKPIRIGGNSVAWLASELDAWVELRLALRNGEEPVEKESHHAN